MQKPPDTLGIRHVALNCANLEAMERFLGGFRKAGLGEG